MSVFIRHEPCPECRRKGWDRKGDNLGRWSDHAYCFSCGYKEETNSQGHFNRFKGDQEFHTVEFNSKESPLPEDTVVSLRQDALTWLKKYHLTNVEIEENHMCWSERKELLIFPFLDDNQEVIAWQGRYFGANKDYPKYVTYGIRQNVFHYVKASRGTTIVVVEDLISAIKVGRVCPSMPLFSSDANKYQLFRISKHFDNVIIWLDPDKRHHAIKLGQRAESFFKTVRVIFTEDDPKCYTTKEIAQYVA